MEFDSSDSGVLEGITSDPSLCLVGTWVSLVYMLLTAGHAWQAYMAEFPFPSKEKVFRATKRIGISFPFSH